jgi:tetratricopeptide (TPR) repeat protein
MLRQYEIAQPHHYNAPFDINKYHNYYVLEHYPVQMKYQRYQALENLGRIYLKLGDVANAEKTFKQALLANRALTPIQSALAP